MSSYKNSVEKENDGIVEEVTSLFEQCKASDADEQLNCDPNDQGFQIVTDIDSVMGQNLHKYYFLIFINNLTWEDEAP